MMRALLLLLLCAGASAQVSTPAINRTNVGRALYPLTNYETGSCGATRANTNQYYDVGHLFRYKAVGDGTTDNVVAWNRAHCSTALSPDRRRITVPEGVFRFGSKPDDLNAVLDIVGVNKDNSVLLADYDEAVPSRGFLQNVAGQGGITITGIRLHKADTRTGGAAINISSSAATAAGFLSFDDLVITGLGTGTWSYGFLVDGSAKSTGSAIGVRLLEITRTAVFSATAECSSFISVINTHIQFSCYPTGGGSQVVRVSGTALVPTTATTIDATFLAEVTLDRIASAIIRTDTSLVVSDTANVLNTLITAAGGIVSDTLLRPARGYIMPSTGGSGTLTFATGCTTTPTVTYRWAVAGRIATISLTQSVACTSNTTTAIYTGVPAALTPASSRGYFDTCSDNGGARTMCPCFVTNTGTLSCAVASIGNAAWTASGTKIIVGTTLTYPLD